jgi:hypothetical protein
VAFGDGTFAIGGHRAILQSDPLLNLELALRPTPQLQLWGPVNRSYDIEFADALTPASNWNTLTNFYATECPASITETNVLRRCYRARRLPR